MKCLRFLSVLSFIRFPDFSWELIIKELLNSAFAGYQNYSDLGQRYLLSFASSDSADLGLNNF